MKRLRTLIPFFIRKKIKLTWRFFQDIKNGHHQLFAKNNSSSLDFTHILSFESQSLRTTPNAENKIHNIRIASQKITELVLFPNEIFSFWKIIGVPNEKNGYVKGRNLMNGQLATSIGGGLCQLSSLIYFLAIKANLNIIERHNHSVDIYNEESRFTPLGSDATVFYGYKDLRFSNPYTFPIRIVIQVEENELIGSFFSTEKMENQAIVFERNDYEKQRIVKTYRCQKNNKIQIAESKYDILT
jgi:vancomycin resistance protein VanW